MSVVLTAVENGVGLLTLNRPDALNAINFEMARAMGQALEEWRDDDQVHMVVIQGAGTKAFCAGGDVRAVYKGMLADDTNITQDFFKYEYLVDRMIAQYPKPYVALGSGVNMGGGLGVTMPGPYRIVSENSRWAMPETHIGFFPDVGAGRFLNDCPGQIGLYLGLLGRPMNAADALYAGLATHYIPTDRADVFLNTLCQAETRDFPEEVLEQAFEIFSEEPPMESELMANRTRIDACFAGRCMEEIIHCLESDGSPWADQTLEALQKVSPTSLKVSLELFNRARTMTLADVLQMDYSLSQKFVAKHDFREGIRALLIDKDQCPQWSPSTLGDVTDEMVAQYFE